MQKVFITLLLIVLNSNILRSQKDHDLINKVVNDFIEGTTYRNADKIRSAFYPGTKMYLYNDQDSLWAVTSEEYASWYNRNPGVKSDRDGRIVTIDIVLDVAYAKIAIDIPFFGNRYYDLLLLKKIEGKWKIISKCTSAEPIPKRPEESIANPVKKVIIENLNHPWSMAFISESDVIIAEKDGDL